MKKNDKYKQRRRQNFLLEGATWRLIKDNNTLAIVMTFLLIIILDVLTLNAPVTQL